MKKIAILADIHGNVPALEAVLADIHDQRPDEVVVGGDMVGRGPEGRRVVDRIRELGWPGVRGNHEDYLLAFRRGEVPDEWLGLDEWAASRWMAAELDDAAETEIAALPMRLTSAVDPRVVVVHGSPRSHSEGIGPWTDADSLEEHVRVAGGRMLVCAHTHRAMIRHTLSGTVVNIGAVGLPFNGDRRAQYAMVHAGASEPRAELRQVPYDVDRTLEIYRESGFLEHGGVTARLLTFELEHARPFLVPFLHWARACRHVPDCAHVPAFLNFYEPGESLPGFFQRIDRLRASRRR